MKMFKDGGSAFPVDELDQQTGSVHTQHFGMSLRDYFAAKAMQMHGEMLSGIAIDGEEAWDEFIAKRAYKTADAMIKVRGL